MNPLEPATRPPNSLLKNLGILFLIIGAVATLWVIGTGIQLYRNPSGDSMVRYFSQLVADKLILELSGDKVILSTELVSVIGIGVSLCFLFIVLAASGSFLRTGVRLAVPEPEDLLPRLGRKLGLIFRLSGGKGPNSGSGNGG